MWKPGKSESGWEKERPHKMRRKGREKRKRRKIEEDEGLSSR